MVSEPILNCPNGVKECRLHVDALGISLGTVLTWHGAGDIDHPVAFASRELSSAKKNYATTEREGLDMVYAL